MPEAFHPDEIEKVARAVAAAWPTDSRRIAEMHPDDQALMRDYQSGGWQTFDEREALLLAQRQKRVARAALAAALPLAEARCQPLARAEIVDRFRDWLRGNVWGADDMGGFVTGQTEAEVVANVGQLFDLIDPRWRDYTAGGSLGDGATAAGSEPSDSSPD